MTDMIERVARAIDPRFWETQDGLKECAFDYWSSPTETTARKEKLAIARAAIEAMREPTLAMLFEGGDAANRECGIIGREAALEAWEAMIDAALVESK